MSGINITGGIASGRKITEVFGKTRPTPARLRRALFDIIGDIEGVCFVDLFAGSGAVGIEALSRGADKAIFVELEHRSCRAIEKNIGAVSLGDADYQIVCRDALIWMKHSTFQNKTIIFASPPYIKEFLPEVIEAFDGLFRKYTGLDILLILQFPKREWRKCPISEPSRIHAVGDDLLLFWECAE